MQYHELSPELAKIEKKIIATDNYDNLCFACQNFMDEDAEMFSDCLASDLEKMTKCADDFDEVANNIVYRISEMFPLHEDLVRMVFGI